MTQNHNNFNVDIVYKNIAIKWKFIVGFVVFSLLITCLVLAIAPKQFSCKTTIIPANFSLADKGRLFNKTLQQLNSFYGDEKEQELIFGLCKLDNIYDSIATIFDLKNYFTANNKTKEELIKCVKNNIKIEKNEYNQIVIIATFNNSKLAANIANKFTQITNNIVAKTWQLQYKNEIKSIENRLLSNKKNSDSLQKNSANTVVGLEAQNSNLMQQKMELLLANSTTPQLFYVVEPANESLYTTTPNIVNVLLAILFASTFLGFLLVQFSFKNNATQ
jgi:hypothetical protein